MLFPVVMCGCESWTHSLAERQRIVFNCGTREGLMLKLKLQYLGHLMGRADLMEKTLMLGKIKGNRRRRWQRMRCLDGITDSMDMSLSNLWETQNRGACCSPWGRKESDMIEEHTTVLPMLCWLLPCIVPGVQLCAAWWTRWWGGGGRSKREGMCIHLQLLLGQPRFADAHFRPPCLSSRSLCICVLTPPAQEDTIHWI